MPLAMIVEDDTDIRNLFHISLTNDGLDTITASSVEDALRLLETHTPDIALVDMNLPGRPGTDLLEHMNHTPALANVRRVVITANPLTETGAEALGIDLFLLKPVSVLDLLMLVRRLLAQDRAT
ncbi:MAG: response regulator [Anaerolineae bacterium]|nr:response regulator [Anaerolineae bacterium]